MVSISYIRLNEATKEFKHEQLVMTNANDWCTRDGKFSFLTLIIKIEAFGVNLSSHLHHQWHPHCALIHSFHENDDIYSLGFLKIFHLLEILFKVSETKTCECLVVRFVKNFMIVCIKVWGSNLVRISVKEVGLSS